MITPADCGLEIPAETEQLDSSFSPVFLRAPCGEDFDPAAIIKPNAALANAALNFQTANRSVPIFELVNLPQFK